MKGMLLQCGGCGYTKQFTFDATPEEIEEQIHHTISDGWRYVPSWEDFICQKCVKGGLDPFYLAFNGGKPRMRNKVNSYKALMFRVAGQLKAFKDLERMYGE